MAGLRNAKSMSALAKSAGKRHIRMQIVPLGHDCHPKSPGGCGSAERGVIQRCGRHEAGCSSLASQGPAICPGQGRSSWR